MPQESQRINLVTRVNRAGIRRETVGGREHLVVSSYTLPSDVVMNGILYPAKEIEAHYKKLEGTLAPFGHPVDENGEFISANTWSAINAYHVGAANRNVERKGNRVHVEKWIDRQTAMSTPNGQRLVAAVEAMERGEDTTPIDTSVALLIRELPPTVEQLEAGIRAVASVVDIDHDAILMDEIGAARPSQGVGLMVNVDQAVAVNASLIDGTSSESYRNRENSLNEAARAKFQNEEYVYVADFSNDHVILVKADGPWQFPYTTENGKITLAETGVKVQRRESWVSSMTNLAANFLKFFKPQASPPETTKEGDEMPMTQEERAALVKETSVAVNEALSPVLTKAIADAVGPLSEALGTLKANQDALTEKLTANSRREETEMREAVKAKYGELVANSLSGDALVEMFKTCGAPAAALAGNAATQPAGDAFNPADFPKE